MQPYATTHQLYTALFLLYAGFLSAFICDLLLPLCRPCGRLIRLAADFFLCATATLLIFLSLYATGSSVLRAYMLVAFAAGVQMYFLSLHRLFHAIANYISGKRKNGTRGE